MNLMVMNINNRGYVESCIDSIEKYIWRVFNLRLTTESWSFVYRSVQINVTVQINVGTHWLGTDTIANSLPLYLEFLEYEY